jgi:ketosteroid isomerase-like protein
MDLTRLKGVIFAILNTRVAYFDFSKLNMKSIFIVLLIIPSCFLVGQAHDIDEMEIQNVLSRQNAAWNRGDVDEFMVGYWESDSLMFIGSSGVTYGYKNTLTNYKKRYPDTAAMGQLVFTLIDFKKLSGEYYHVTGKWYLKRSIGDAGGHFTLLFRKIKGQWVIISDHSS